MSSSRSYGEKEECERTVLLVAGWRTIRDSDVVVVELKYPHWFVQKIPPVSFHSSDRRRWQRWWWDDDDDDYYYYGMLLFIGPTADGPQHYTSISFYCFWLCGLIKSNGQWMNGKRGRPVEWLLTINCCHHKTWYTLWWLFYGQPPQPLLLHIWSTIFYL